MEKLFTITSCTSPDNCTTKEKKESELTDAEINMFTGRIISVFQNSPTIAKHNFISHLKKADDI